MDNENLLEDWGAQRIVQHEVRGSQPSILKITPGIPGGLAGLVTLDRKHLPEYL